MPHKAHRSAVDKRPVSGPVAILKHGVDGDEQFERKYHGGPDKAVHLYAGEDLAWWSERLGFALPPGFIGENLTTSGVDLNALHPGDELTAGSAVLRVTQPRDPCAKLAARLAQTDFVRRFGRAGRTGLYCAVVREGFVACGDTLVIRAGERSEPSIRALVARKYGTEESPHARK